MPDTDLAGRISFFLFLVLSIPVGVHHLGVHHLGVHHQFSDPNISQSSKITTTLLTFGVALPSFITAFTLAASLEYAGRLRGARGCLAGQPPGKVSRTKKPAGSWRGNSFTA